MVHPVTSARPARPLMHNCKIMGEVDKFVFQFLYDIERFLRRKLDALKEDLRSDDDGIRKLAEEKVVKISNWLFHPLPPLSEEERLQRTEEALSDKSLSPSERLRAISRLARSSGRRKGRPWTDTAQHAVLALTMHYATKLSWREIALAVRGCKHERPTPERSCKTCGDSIRDAAGRLEKSLIEMGFEKDFPRGDMSLGDLAREE
jgi:hypothetical protein